MTEAARAPAHDAIIRDQLLKAFLVDVIGLAAGQAFAVIWVPFRVLGQVAELDQVEHVDRPVARQVLECLPVLPARIHIARHGQASASL